jgi:hypothetical protein
MGDFDWTLTAAHDQFGLKYCKFSHDIPFLPLQVAAAIIS